MKISEKIKKNLNYSIKKLLSIFYRKFGYKLDLTKNKYIFELARNIALNSFKYANDIYIGEINDINMFFNAPNLMHFLIGEYETETVEVFLNEINEGYIVVDIGANIGIFTLLASKLVGEKGKVFAFEPDPENFSLLIKNIELNDYKNIIPINKAVSNKTDSTNFFLRENTAVHSLIDGFNNYPSRKVIKVQTTTLDDFFLKNEYLNIDFIKMDIEGAEMLALIGMSNLLKDNKKLSLVSEFNPDFINKSGYSPKDFLSKINDYNFQIKIIGNENKKVENVIDEIHPELGINLFCYKN